MAEYIITQADLDKGNSYLKTLTAEHPVCRIADSVTSIGVYVFYGCSSLTSITIPNSVTSIGNGAFYDCSGLTSITIPNGVTTIGGNAFQKCTSLTSITIPNSVTSIGNSVFYGCSGLTSITIPDSVTSIGEYAFYNCTSLTSITIPSSVTSIGIYVFYGCSSLTSITIPSSVTSIGSNVFSGCPNLKTIYVSGGFDTTLLDGKVPEGATIEVKHLEELITLSQLKAYDEEKTNIWHNSFTTNNLTVDNANVTDLTVNSFTTNNLTADNANVTDLTVNSSTVVNGDVFTHKGFDVASTKVISEYDYNQLGEAARSDAFYVTSPNGNMYFRGMKWAPSYVPSYSIAYVNLPSMAAGMNTLTTSTLTFTSGAVTNSFVYGGAYSTIFNKTPFGVYVDMFSPVGVQANDGSIITNANELYIVNARNMYNNCVNLTDTFVCNPSLITNAPSDYDPMKYCTNMAYMFRNCYNFNQPVRIPDSVTDVDFTFWNCHNFNQPVNIPDSVNKMWSTFANCYNFNQPVTLGNNVNKLLYTLANCQKFNQPVNIPDGVTYMEGTFLNCNTLRNSTVPIHISHTIALGNTSNYIYNCLVNGNTGISFAPSRILNDL